MGLVGRLDRFSLLQRAPLHRFRAVDNGLLIDSAFCFSMPEPRRYVMQRPVTFRRMVRRRVEGGKG
jgi:hypothetical protein